MPEQFPYAVALEEFFVDSVLIADSAAILTASPRGRNDLYVALTRATQRLGILHPGPPPAELARIRAGGPAQAVARCGR